MNILKVELRAMHIMCFYDVFSIFLEMVVS